MKTLAIKYFSIVQISARSKLAYFWDILGTGVFFVVVMFIFVKLWQATFKSQGSQIEGFSLNQMIWYLVGTELLILTMPYVHRLIEKEIREGDVALRLNKPYSFFLFHYCQFIGEQFLRTLILLIIGGSVVYMMIGGIDFNFWHLPMIALSFLLAGVLNFTYAFIIGVLTFWFEDISGVYFILDRVKWLMGGFLLPITVFPGVLRTIAEWLPFKYFIFAPAKLLVHFNWLDFIEVVGKQSLLLIVFVAIAQGLYFLGVKKLNVNGG